MKPRTTATTLILIFCSCLLLIADFGGGAIAAPGRTTAYALLVGSNHGGPGQKPLRFARNDALRVRAVLTQVGGYAPENIWTVLDPKPDELIEKLKQIAERLQTHAARGERSLFIFYYSGHARSRALSVGAHELKLEDLRRRLTSMSATMTVAILDACQSGAISRVKGAVPAADFSFNSINDLRTAGVAVMASSSASELSQEAASLGASYFTHHLVVGLRGAADEDGDGGITLSEAYRYAYNRTLVATAATAVGKQHVTLETQLRGKGEMVLTYPSRAGSILLLPRQLAGQVLVHREPKKIVVAELSKARGKPLSLALPPGRYVAVLRQHPRALRCELTLPGRGRAVLAPRNCQALVPEAAASAKGGAWRESWGLEVGVGLLWPSDDAYLDTLGEFRFEEQDKLFGVKGTLSVAVSHRLSRHLSVMLSWSMLDRAEWRREAFDKDAERRNQYFDWSAHAIGAHLRGQLQPVRWFRPYLQLGGGVAWATTAYRDRLQASPVLDDELHWGFHLAVAGGLQFMPWRFLGFFIQASYVYAPVISNEVGDTHNSGGSMLIHGVRGAL